MKKQLGKLLGGIFLCLLSFFVHDLSSSNGEELIFSKVIVSGFSQTMCDPPAEMCGPLMGNSSGTRYCCANTDSSCCYAGGCGGGSNT